MKDNEEPVGDGVVWVAVALTAAYVMVHVPMLYRSVLLWGGLLRAAVGQ